MTLNIKLLLNHIKKIEYLTIYVESGNGLNEEYEICDEDSLKKFIRKNLGFKNSTEIIFNTMNSLGADAYTFNKIYVDGDVNILINSEDEYKFYHRKRILEKLL